MKNEWMQRKTRWIILMGINYTEWALGKGDMDVYIGVVGMNQATIHKASQGFLKMEMKPDFHVHEGVIEEGFANINTIANQAWERDSGVNLRMINVFGKKIDHEIEGVIWAAKGVFQDQQEFEVGFKKVELTLWKMGIEKAGYSRIVKKSVKCKDINNPWVLPWMEWIKEATQDFN